MKVMSIGLLVFGVASAVAPTASFALLRDFICKNSLSSTAVFYGGENNHLRDCSMTQPDPSVGMCQESVQCAFLSPENQTQLLSRYNSAHASAPLHNYDDISTKDKLALVEQLHLPLTFHDATVTCDGKVSGGSHGEPTCPTPDRCKGDALVKPRVAAIAVDKDGSDVPSRPTTFVPQGGDGSSSGGATTGISREFQ